MRIEVQRLIKQAERDLENARKNIAIAAYEVSAFLAEQSVEKYLKACWMALKKEPPPFTHSLTELGDGLGVPYEVYDHETAEAKVASAEAILQWLRGQIPG